ncbi:thioesterase superfamily protein [Brucella intermedia LMG 3301]|nr:MULTISPECIES: thioesterase family protein [Brucella]EEQ94672.1 thioesterase superfamily protein [Brucella intermedia LMG 3301]OOC59908.1 thioesterase [Brucella intermedia M86]OAB83637.1 thioesterase [Brucella intermedia]OAE37001.1 thioesterase [Brucella intermedia]SUA87572.1 Acyl-ACP thioesterase [Brucella intermedia]
MTASKPRPKAEPRSAYREFYQMQTRWSDMDIYGHVNNVVYMQYCDAALNRSLIAAGALDLLGSTPIGIVARNSTNYFAEISYPDNVAVGVRVEHIGNTSLLWGFGIFKDGEELAAAKSEYVHVYVNRDTRRPVALTPELRQLAERLYVPASAEEI